MHKYFHILCLHEFLYVYTHIGACFILGVYMAISIYINSDIAIWEVNYFSFIWEINSWFHSNVKDDDISQWIYWNFFNLFTQGKLLPRHLLNIPLWKMEIFPETVARHNAEIKRSWEGSPTQRLHLHYSSWFYNSGSIAEAEGGKIIRARMPGLHWDSLS